MSTLDTLHTVAEVGITVTGFSGVVLALRPSIPIDARPFDRRRIILLLAQSLGTVCLAFLPALLSAARFGDPAVWRASNGVFAVVEAFLIVWIWQGRRESLRDHNPLNSVLYLLLTTGVVLAAACGANALGAWTTFGPALYLAGVLFMLAMSMLNFVMLALPAVMEGRNAADGGERPSADGGA